MPYDEGLAERLREQLVDYPGIAEKKMFGGLAFMYRGHMLAGILGDSLMARVGPAEYANSLKHPHVREMDFTGKPLIRLCLCGSGRNRVRRGSEQVDRLLLAVQRDSASEIIHTRGNPESAVTSRLLHGVRDHR